MATPKFTRAALAANPTYALRSRVCEVCFSRENLKLCKNCLVTYYCSQEHQTSDLERHTEKCCYMGGIAWLFFPTPKIISYIWGKPQICPIESAREKDRLILSKVDIMLHLFPNIAATEMSRRFLARIYKKYSSPDRAWESMYETIADLIPVIDVRQCQEEAAYKFIYRHTKDEVYRPMNWVPTGSVPPSKARRSFEEIQGHASLAHQVVLTLMAIKALRHVQDMKNVFICLRKEYIRERYIPQEIIDHICEQLGSTAFLANLFGIDLVKATADASWRQAKISEMRWVVTKCVYEAGHSNKHIWRLMLDTDRLAAPGEFGRYATKVGWDLKEMAEAVAVRQYQVWMETPGSFDVLKKAMTQAARWASVEGYCWPIERRINRDGADDMPRLHHYHQQSRVSSRHGQWVSVWR